MDTGRALPWRSCPEGLTEGEVAEVAEVAEASTGGTDDGDRSVELGGYQQELKRTLGSFQVFAISFASSRWPWASSRRTTKCW